MRARRQGHQGGALQARVLTARSALARKESRGTLFRLDYPESIPEWKRPLLVRKTEDSHEVSFYGTV
jgi:aspartate oxidase